MLTKTKKKKKKQYLAGRAKPRDALQTPLSIINSLIRWVTHPLWKYLYSAAMPKRLKDGALIKKIDYIIIFRRFLIWMAIKIAWRVQELQKFFCMIGFCLFVELHQDGSAPATCAVSLFSFYIEKNRCVDFFLAGNHNNLNRRLGVSKTNLCFVLHSSFLAKVWNLKIFLLSNAFSFLSGFPENLSTIPTQAKLYVKINLLYLVVQCVWSKNIWNKETLDKEISLIFVVLFLYFSTSNLSQKTQHKKVINFWDTLTFPMRNVGCQPTDIWSIGINFVKIK